MTTKPSTTRKRTLSPLLYPAATLSLASLAWTTWSIVGLLGAGPIGFTVATGADIIWGSVIIAEARGIRVSRRPWIVPAFGWATLLVVALFLAWHGLNEHSYAMAAAGPFLPFGAKAVWILALADMRDPAALTDDDKATLAAMERRMAFEETQHDIEMRRRTMQAELVMREVSTDFDIELMRQDRVRDLHRKRPFELTAAAESHHRTDTTSASPDGRHDAPPQRVSPAAAAAPRRTADLAPHQSAASLADGMSKAEAVRIIRDADPTASAPQIAERLAHHGIEADPAYVRTVLSRIKAKDRSEPSGGYL